MKKLISLVLAVIMVAAILASTLPVISYKTNNFWLDWYRLNGYQVTPAEHNEIFKTLTNEKNPPLYVKHDSNPNNDTVLILGWIQLENSMKVTGLGLKMDDGAINYSSNYFTKTTNIPGCQVDRSAELNAVGFTNGEGYVFLFNYHDLSVGTHTVSFYAKGDDNVDNAANGTPEAPVVWNTCIDNQYMQDDVIYIDGWTGANYELEDLGYRFDKDEPVFGDGCVTVTQLPDDNPVKFPENGGKYAVRFSATLDLWELDVPDGQHRLEIVAKLKDANNSVVSIHKIAAGLPGGAIGFVYGDLSEKEGDLWLCEKQEPFATGWWIFPNDVTTVEEYDINVDFDSPIGFDGFVMSCFAGADPLPLTVFLLDENENILEEKELRVYGDHSIEAQGFIKVSFSKAYKPGFYTIDFHYDYPGEDEYNNEYFVLGSGYEGDIEDVVVTGATNKNTLDAPAIRLLFVDVPADETGTDTASDTDESVSEPDDTGTDTDEPASDTDDTGKDTSGNESDTDATGIDTDETKNDPDDTGKDASGTGSEPEDVKAKDVDGDGEANNKDVVFLFRYVSKGEAEYDAKYDIDNDGEVNNKDVVSLFRALSSING